MANRRAIVTEPALAEDEVVAFDDLDARDPEGPEHATPEQLVDLLRRALPELRGQPAPQPNVDEAAAGLRQGLATDERPHRYIRRAAGFDDDVPPTNEDLLVAATSGFMVMPAGVGLSPNDEDSVRILAPADWLGAIVGLARMGPGTSARPVDLVRMIDEAPEVDGAVPADRRERVEAGFEIVLPVWEAVGVVDGDWNLTAVGAWALPRALARAWGGDFDGGDEPPAR